MATDQHDAAAGQANAALSRVLRADRGRLTAALIAALGSFDLAEEALADAAEAALIHWPRGVPGHPQGWLLRVARRKAIDRIRRTARWRDRQAALTMLAEADLADAAEPPPEIPDERLRLIFTCCHPALDPKSRVALTLRTLGGLTTEEIARAFLDQPATMGQRLSRAKAKIAGAGIPFAVPDAQDWAARLDSVLAVIYLIFNEGYAATQGEGQLRVDLCEEAVFLARMLSGLLPAEAEPLGLLALILTTHARRPARVGTGVGGRDGGGGALIPLDAQDRGLWDRQLIGEGLAALDRAMALRQPGPCQIKAAISALHVQADSYPATDWPQMLLLYDSLLAHEPSDVVRLNRAVALAEVAGARAALAALAPLADTLADYQPFHAARAHLLAADGQRDAARAAYDRAIALSGTAAERRFLEIRRAGLG